MNVSAHSGVARLDDGIELRWDGVGWRRLLAVSTAAAVIVYTAAVALPRYMLTGDLRREIESLAVPAEQLDDEAKVAAAVVASERKDGLRRFIEPADLVPAVTGVARRAGLQLVAVKQMLPPAASSKTRRIRLHATASFDQVVDFVDELVAISPTLHVEALNLRRPTGPDAGPVKLDLECTLLAESRAPTPAGAPASEKLQ